MIETEQDLRDRLSRTWKALMARLMDYDFPSHMVFETLAEVATDGVLEQHGPAAAAQMLRLRADAIEAEEGNRVRELLVGESAGPIPTEPLLSMSDFAPWPSNAADQDAALDLIGR